METNRELFERFTQKYLGFGLENGILLEVLMCSSYDSMAVDEDVIVEIDPTAAEMNRQLGEYESSDSPDAVTNAAKLDKRLVDHFQSFWRAIGFFRTSPLDKEYINDPMGAILAFEGPVRKLDEAGWFAVTTIFDQFLDGGLWETMSDAISYAARHPGGENDLDAYQAIFPLEEKKADCSPQVEAATALATICQAERPKDFELVISDPSSETFCLYPGELSSNWGTPSIGRLPGGGKPELEFFDGRKAADYVDIIRRSLSQAKLTKVQL